jgi:hypothetical protein
MLWFFFFLAFALKRVQGLGSREVMSVPWKKDEGSTGEAG